jgi:hypothetical protein
MESHWHNIRVEVVLMTDSVLTILKPAMPLQYAREEEADLRLARFLYCCGLLTIGELTIRPAFSLTLSDLLFFASLVSACPSLLSRHFDQGFLPRGILFGSYLFCLGALLSAFGAPQPLLSLLRAVKFNYLTLVWFLLGTIVLRRPADVRTAVGCWVLSLAFSGAGAVAQLFRGDVIPATAVFAGRMTGFTQHVNDLGGSAAVAFVAAVWFATNLLHFKFVPFTGAIPMILVAAGVILSGSVGGLIAATVGIIAYLALARTSLRVIMLAAVIAGTAFAVMHFQVHAGALTPLERIQQVQQQGGTLSTRLDTNRSVIPRIASNPLIGVGLGVTAQVNQTNQLVHNELLGVWYEGGGLAFLGLLLLFASLMTTALDARRCALDDSERLLCSALLACLLAYFTFGMGSPMLFERYGWVPAALLLAVRAQQRRTNTASESAGQMRQATAGRFRRGDL